MTTVGAGLRTMQAHSHTRGSHTFKRIFFMRIVVALGGNALLRPGVIAVMALIAHMQRLRQH